MHPFRVIAAMIAGGYASILAAYALAQAIGTRADYAGLCAVGSAPLVVAACAFAVLVITNGWRE